MWDVILILVGSQSKPLNFSLPFYRVKVYLKEIHQVAHIYPLGLTSDGRPQNISKSIYLFNITYRTHYRKIEYPTTIVSQNGEL